MTPAPVDARVITPRRPGVPSHGARIGRIMRALGVAPMPWQRDAAGLFGEYDPVTGLRLNDFCVLSVQRQAGKTELVQAMAVERCLMAGPSRRVWYTAQNGGKAAEKWGEVATRLCAPGSPLAGYVAAKWSRGGECLTFPNGSTFQPFPPTKDALHSKQSDLVLVDEAWKHSEEAGAEILQAISPTQSTRPGAQVVLLSTMGTVAGSKWFHGWVDRGRAADPSVTYAEWGIGDEGDPEDMAAVCAAHPAVGRTISAEFVARQLPILGGSEFARAFGNARTAVVSAIIPAAAWTLIRHRDARPAMGRAMVLAVDVALDQSATAIVAVWPDVEGTPTVEVVEYRPGSEWAGARCAELRARHRPAAFLSTGEGPVLTVVGDAKALGCEITHPSSRELTAACAGTLDKITAGSVQHRGETPLDDAVAGAARRSVGDGGWVWARRQAGADVAPLMAMSLAVWGYAHRPAELRPAVTAG